VQQQATYVAAYAFAETTTLMQKQSGHVKRKIYAQVILEIRETSLHVAYLGRPVEPTLDVRVHGAVLKAG